MTEPQQTELKKEDLDHHLQTALQAVEGVLQEKGSLSPHEVSGHFSHAVRCVVELRDRIIADANGQGNNLPHSLKLNNVNALISMMASIEYPRVGIQWSRIEEVRDGLKRMLNP
jgi:hypothetical protein